jgi:hypothetical protein
MDTVPSAADKQCSLLNMLGIEIIYYAKIVDLSPEKEHSL